MNQYRNLLFIFFIGLILRISVIELIHKQHYSTDEVEYIYIAKNLVENSAFVDSDGELTKRSPLFPFFLSLLFRLFGTNIYLSQIINCFISAIAIVLIYILSINIWNDKSIALVTSSAVAFYPGLVFSAGLLQTECLYIIFFLLVFIFSVKFISNDSLILGVLLGITAGLATLTRAVFFGYFPVLMLVIWLIKKRSSVSVTKFIAISIICWCLVLSPWIIRNYRIFNTFVPVSSWGGSSLLVGNNPYATGTWRTEKEFKEWFNKQALEYGINDLSQLNEVEKDFLSRKIAINYILSNPTSTLKLALKKAHMFLIYPATHTDKVISVQLVAVALDFFILIGLILGIVSTNHNKKVLLILSAILYFFIIQVILHAEARYRIPLVPLFCLFFGYGVNTLFDEEQRKKFFASKSKLVVSGVLITLVILIYAYTGILFLRGII